MQQEARTAGVGRTAVKSKCTVTQTSLRANCSMDSLCPLLIFFKKKKKKIGGKKLKICSFTTQTANNNNHSTLLIGSQKKIQSMDYNGATQMGGLLRNILLSHSKAEFGLWSLGDQF